jgi:hypothetical protein
MPLGHGILVGHGIVPGLEVGEIAVQRRHPHCVTRLRVLARDFGGSKALVRE